MNHRENRIDWFVPVPSSSRCSTVFSVEVFERQSGKNFYVFFRRMMQRERCSKRASYWCFCFFFFHVDTKTQRSTATMPQSNKSAANDGGLCCGYCGGGNCDAEFCWHKGRIASVSSFIWIEISRSELATSLRTTVVASCWSFRTFRISVVDGCCGSWAGGAGCCCAGGF